MSYYIIASKTHIKNCLIFIYKINGNKRIFFFEEKSFKIIV